MLHRYQRFIPICLLLSSFMIFIYFRLDRYLTFESLKSHREQLLNWRNQHYLATIGIFMLTYIIAVAVSIPGATFLTLAGGFLFGILLGTILVVISATIGSVLIFLAVQTALEPYIANKAGPWVNKMRAGFQEGAFQYLMVLRLVPLFPFWIVNIVPGLLGVKTSTYVITTFLGIIPGSFVYVLLGNGLGHIFDQNQVPNLGIIFEPQVLWPLLALAALSFVPSLYKKFKRSTT